MKLIYHQFTFLIARAKRFLKPLQILFDGNLGNVYAGVLISKVAYQCKRREKRLNVILLGLKNIVTNK